MNMFPNLEVSLCKELNKLEEKYRSGAEMSEGDLRKADLLCHTLKSLLSYCEKKEAEEMQNNNYYVPNTRYMGQNMNQNMNGQYPPYNDRRW